MGKKGKPSGHHSRKAAAPSGFDPKASRIARLETAEDAEGGDEDEFHRNRDTVLFEDDGSKGRADLDDLSDEDEIYGLNLPLDDSDDAGEEDVEEDEEEYEEEEDDALPTLPEAEAPRGRFAKTTDPLQDMISDDEASEQEKAANSSDEEETWAPASYHASRRAPGEPDSSDDEALDLEANEARRLQKRARGAMGSEDYGFGDEEAVEEVRETARGKGKLEEEEKGVEEKGMGEEEGIAWLVKRSPETLALLDDFRETAERMEGVERNLEIVRGGDEDGKEHPALAIMELEHQALSTYLPTLAFYFSLLLSPAPSPPLLEKVLARLSSLREALATMEELDLTSAGIESDEESESESEEDDADDSLMLASDVWDLGEGIAADDDSEDDSEEDSEDDDEELGDDEEMMDFDEYDSEGEEEVTDSMLAGLEDDELEALIADMAGDADADMLIAKVKSVQRAKLGLPPLEEEESAFEEQVGEKRKRSSKSEKAAKKAQKEADKKNPLRLVPVLEPLSSSSLRKIAPIPSTSSKPVNDDYLDPTALSRTDESDKASKRHTLRFHVSQVHQKQVKRESGGKERIGGDDDLPRRSKERSRREVLKRQEHGGSAGEALDGMDWKEEDREAARSVKSGAKAGEEEGEEYYDLVKQGREEGRKAKKDKYDGERQAEKAALDELADESAAGPRGATRKILANKGLQPKRAKVNRNPRVKKRLRYDKAVKKVATMKAVYKGGMASLGHGEYQGEKSGIGAKVVKSVRLGGK